jgi:hypothetical protein
MPRKSKLQQDVEAAIAAFPFAAYRDGSDPAAFANLPEKVQAGIAKCIASDLAAGGTGKDLRAKYSDSDRTNVGLTGPRRREVLRAFGYGGAVRRSYEAYSDAEPRKGSAHASMHGPNAAERQAVALAAGGSGRESGPFRGLRPCADRSENFLSNSPHKHLPCPVYARARA